MVQYLQSLLQGMPLAAQNATFAEDSGFTQALNSAGGAQELYEKLQGFFGDAGEGTPIVNEVDDIDLDFENISEDVDNDVDDLDLIGSGE